MNTIRTILPKRQWWHFFIPITFVAAAVETILETLRPPQSSSFSHHDCGIERDVSLEIAIQRQGTHIEDINNEKKNRKPTHRRVK